MLIKVTDWEGAIHLVNTASIEDVTPVEWGEGAYIRQRGRATVLRVRETIEQIEQAIAKAGG